MLGRYKLRDYDFKLIVLVLMLTIIGILAIGSAKPSAQERQLVGAVVGIGFMIIFSMFDYNLFRYIFWYLYAINVILLMLVEFYGVMVNNATRWVEILGVQFQPSETAKILLLLFYAQFIMKNKNKINNSLFVLISLLLLLPPIYLIYKQPDLSTTSILCIIYAISIFIGGINKKIVISIIAIIVPVIFILIVIIMKPGQTLFHGYQVNRVLAWLQPENYADTTAYQQINSIIAIGSGQLYGKGLNNNVIASVKNGNFISEPQTDFIFAVVGEEMGFIGACLVIVLISLIAIECMIIAIKAQDIAGSIIAGGIGAIIGFQGFMNIAVNSGLFPNTGIPLPFVSYGLTSLISMYIGIGIVLNIRLQANKRT